MIRAYTGRPSVRAGETLTLHVSGGARQGEQDHYDPRSPSQTFAHWDTRFIRWMARCGYAADFRTDLDIHAQPSLRQDYRLMVSVGHDEYWSEDTRDAVEDFVAGGGWWDGPRDTPGFIVQQPGHWIFAGTGLAHGASLGADTWPPLPGYECDGVPVDHIGPDGQAILSAWRDEAGTPDGYQLLAACPLDRRW